MPAVRLRPAAAVGRLALPVVDRGLQRVHRMYVAYLLVMVVGGLFLVLTSHRAPVLQLLAVVGLVVLALLGVAEVRERSVPGADAACAVALGTATLAVDAPSTTLGLLFAVVCVHATTATPGRRGWAWLASSGPYRPELRAQLQERLALAEDLRRAVAADALEVHFQPCFDAARRITTTEALVRWHHEDHGYVPPDRFIPLAEATDLIHDLGRQVLRTACAQTRRWQDQLGRRLGVNVHVSGRQLGDPRLVDDVAQALAASGLAPGDLTVQVTETALLSDPQRARTALLALRELGVRIALDDFGTGFSSLERLRTMPVDCLKIDQQFVRDLDAPAGRALVRSVIDLAHALGLGTVAEGVEQPDQRDWLVAHGCDVLQGYLLARPVPAASLTHLLAGRPATALVD